MSDRMIEKRRAEMMASMGVSLPSNNNPILQQQQQQQSANVVASNSQLHGLHPYQVQPQPHPQPSHPLAGQPQPQPQTQIQTNHVPSSSVNVNVNVNVNVPMMNGGGYTPQISHPGAQQHAHHSNNNNIHHAANANLPHATHTANGAAAVMVLKEEEQHIQKLLHLIATAASSTQPQPTTQSSGMGTQLPGTPSPGGFTSTPAALTRRLLQRSGVSYTDETVATITSMAADRFLVSILSQSMACRDRRVRGEELLKTERKSDREWRRKRRLEYREFETKRRMTEGETVDKLWKDLQPEEEAGSTAAMGGNKSRSAASRSKNKKKGSSSSNAAAAALAAVAAAPPAEKEKEEDDQSQEFNEDDDEFLNEDSSDEQPSDENDEDLNSEDDNDEKEARRYTLQLRDVVRPLEAWGVNLTGKFGTRTGLFDMEAEEDLELLRKKRLGREIRQQQREAEYTGPDGAGGVFGTVSSSSDR